MQTLLKGSFSLLGVKSPRCALMVSATNIQLFFKIFDLTLKNKGDNLDTFLTQNNIDFPKVFNFLFETMRGLLIYAKEGEFDKLFMEDDLVLSLATVITKLYCDHSEFVLKLTSKIVNKKVITNDD